MTHLAYQPSRRRSKEKGPAKKNRHPDLNPKLKPLPVIRRRRSSQCPPALWWPNVALDTATSLPLGGRKCMHEMAGIPCNVLFMFRDT